MNLHTAHISLLEYWSVLHGYIPNKKAQPEQFQTTTKAKGAKKAFLISVIFICDAWRLCRLPALNLSQIGETAFFLGG